MIKPNTEQFIGKTLREVREMHPNVRVTRAGDVGFVGTCDYRLDRLNVRLSEKGLTFVTKSVTFDGTTHEHKKVDGSMDDGIVISASFG